MSVYKFKIDGQLPSLNEFINALKRNRFIGAKLKSDVENNIMIQLSRNPLNFKLNYPVKIVFRWQEETVKRDLDNIASAKKFILDAFVKKGILIDDNRKYVSGFEDIFEPILEAKVYKKLKLQPPKAYVEITITDSQTI